MAELNEALARKVLEVVDCGLVDGVGDPEPGKMCVEAAVCYALGEDHGDRPSCVGEAVRDYKIGINDGTWSSDAARAKGLRRVAIAQLGSKEIDQVEFAKYVSLQTIREILPRALRAVAPLIPEYTETLNGAANACESAEGLDAAAHAAARADHAAAHAAARAAARAARAARTAHAAAHAAADAAAHAAARAAHAADEILTKAAEIAVQALIKCKCKGCEWLGLAA